VSNDDEDRGFPPAGWPPEPYPPDDRYGRAWIAPADPVAAASTGTWTLTYVAGKYGIDDAGSLRIMFHNNSDFAVPQFSEPAAPNYCAVACSTPAPRQVEAHYGTDLGVRPFKKGVQFVVRDAAVRPGDTLTITFGARSGGSPGTTMQTFAGRLRFHLLLDAHGTGVYHPVGVPPEIEVRAGEPDHLRIHAPSDAVAGEPFDVTIAVRDRWGNVVSRRREPHTLGDPGVHTVAVLDAQTGLTGESNPIRVAALPPLLVGEAARSAGEGVSTVGEAAADPRADVAGKGVPPPAKAQIPHPHPSPLPGGEGTGAARSMTLWGDLHAQTEETGGTGSLDEYFTFARDCAALDFAGHQANDFIISAQAWERITAKTAAYDAANAFVTFAGYEWSGNTPAGGDHNVHFRGGDRQSWTLHRSSHWQVLDHADEATDRYPVTALYDAFRGRDDVLLIPHVGGRYADLRAYFDEAVMPLVEIASCWGVFEWFAADALARGKILGFSAGSDDHTSRLGMSFAAPSQFATGGGLTAVLATDHSRAAIWEALRARRTYATTGPRLLLDVTAVVGGRRYPMGAVVDPDEGPQGPHDDGVSLEVSVHGTAPLWRVEVLRWPDVVYRHPLPPPDLPPARHRLRIGWTGARIRARRRLTRWDGTLTLGSAAAGGRLLGATGWGFDRPDHGILAADVRQVRWCSDTAGDWDGIVVEVEGGEDLPLTFTSGPATFAFRPADVAGAPLEVDAGGVGQRVVVERDPGQSQPRAAAFTYRDERPPAGRHPYFVRVTQQDGHVAWSSPIYVTFRS
jgi:hypothetical protein